MERSQLSQVFLCDGPRLYSVQYYGHDKSSKRPHLSSLTRFALWNTLRHIWYALPPSSIRMSTSALAFPDLSMLTTAKIREGSTSSRVWLFKRMSAFPSSHPTPNTFDTHIRPQCAQLLLFIRNLGCCLFLCKVLELVYQMGTKIDAEVVVHLGAYSVSQCGHFRSLGDLLRVHRNSLHCLSLSFYA